MNIERYILVKSKTNGLDFFHYLQIHGGSGDDGRGKHRHGGKFDFILFYCLPDAMEGCDICVRIWCEQKHIPYGEGTTIEEAYKNYHKKLKEKPLTCG